MKCIGLIALVFLLGGCTSPFEDMPDNELADKVYACTSSTEQSPGFAIRCDNYKKECKRRRDEGKYVC